MFFQAEGEGALLSDCLVSPSASVHGIALEIILYLLKKSSEYRAHLLQAGLSKYIHVCQTQCIEAGSIVRF
jgi:hypothetical protein